MKTVKESIMLIAMTALMLTNIAHAENADRDWNTLGQASKLCKLQGKRLPTPREFAVEATKYGAKILETEEVPGVVPYGFNIMITENINGADHFYYSNENYKNPSLSEEQAWTDSSITDYNQDQIVFDKTTGSFRMAMRGIHKDNLLVICVD